MNLIENKRVSRGSVPREKSIFAAMTVAHVLAVFIPLALISFGFWEMEKEEELSINIVDEPSVGPVVAPETTRLAPAEEPAPEPTVEPEPSPAPEPVSEPEPVLVPEPEVVPVPVPDFTPPPMPVAPQPVPSPRPILQPVVSQPKFDLPKLPKLPAPKSKPKAEPKRKFTPLEDRRMVTPDTKKRSGTNNNPLVPVGERDAAQRYGEKFSNTPQGGKNSSKNYTVKLAGFLKMHWRSYAPSRAELGGANLEVRVSLYISGTGGVLSCVLTSSSGNARMDAAVRRMLSNLKQFPAPEDGKAVRISNIVIEALE